MLRNKTMRIKLRKMKELRRFFLKTKKNLGKLKSKKKQKESKKKVKKEKKKYTKKQIKKIFILRPNKKLQKGGSVNFQPLTDVTRSGLNQISNVKDTFLGNN